MTKNNVKEVKKSIVNVLGKVGLRDRIIEPPTIDENKPFVYYAFLNNIEYLQDADTENSEDLPNSLIIPKGKFFFHGKGYELKKEGLYRFIYPGIENQQRIVYEKNLDAILSGIAWIYSHGNSDDEKEFSKINKKALHSKIFATCGHVSDWTCDLLKTRVIRSRVVASLTLDPWNSYDNGHIMIEVYRNDFKKWVVYDLDNNCFFTKNKVPLSLIEFSDCVKTEDYEINYLANNSNLDTFNFIDKRHKFDFAFLLEARFVNEDSHRQWYKRVMQVPMIADGKYSYFFNSNDILRVQNYSSYYKYMNKKEFLEKFYHQN